MKKTPDTLPGLDRTSWSDRLEESPLIQWVIHQGRNIIYGLAALILLAILIVRFWTSGKTGSEADFITAEKEYVLFATPSKSGTESPEQKEAFIRLGSFLDAHPELYPKYDGPIAQLLLIRGNNSQAINYATLAIDRTTDENDPFYKGYAQTTLTIASGDYQQALKESQALKDQMILHGQEFENTPEKLSFSTLLYSLNLLRIGMLQQQLSLSSEELKTWQEWKELIRKSNDGSLPQYLDDQLFMTFNQLLSEGNISFENYIDIREKNINQ